MAAQLANFHKGGGLPLSDHTACPEEDGKYKQKRERAEARTHPESGPVANRLGTDGRREEIDRAPGEERADKHPDAIRHKRVKALGRIPEAWRCFLIGIELAGHEEKIVTNAVDNDGEIKHPHALA